MTFAAAANPTSADLHFAATDIAGSSTTGLCSWSHGWSYNSSNTVTRFSATAYIYLDNVEWGFQNNSPIAGTSGYETLLHEIGHALGLKHPFEGTTVLARASDNTSNTVMSYTESGGPYSTYSPYDVAALMWIYGGDGLGGNLGAASTSRYIVGTSTADTIVGTSSNDKLEGLGGNDRLDGGNGVDTAVFSGTRAGHSVTNTSTGWTVTSTTEGIDTLTSIERLIFADATVALDISGTAGQAYRIYQAAFNRAADAAGLGYWISVMDSGATLNNIAQGFVDSPEFKKLYGTSPTNAQVVAKMYDNVLHRTPDQAGYDYWVGVLDRREASVAAVLATISESPENQAALVGVIGNGIVFTPYGG
jgi:hypothetical protein